MSNKVNSFEERFKGKIENMGKDGVMGLVKTTQNASPISSKPMNQLPKPHSQGNDPFAGWSNAYNNAKKTTKKGNIASSGAIIANQQQAPSHHQVLPPSQPIYHPYAANIPPYQMAMKPQPNSFQIPIPYQQPYQPYAYMPYPPVLNYAPPQQMPYYPPYVFQGQPQAQPQAFIPSNKPININITNNVQQKPIENTLVDNKAEQIANDYKPYTLEDYKELNRVAVVMGNLGPNIGTKEWEEKKKKMKRISDYSNKLNKEQKGISRIKTETPADEKARERQSQIEESHRFKSFEYGKLVRPKGITSDQYYYKDIGTVQTKNEKSEQILHELNSKSDKTSFEQISLPLSHRDNTATNDNNQALENNANDNHNDQLDYLLQQRETYKHKIDAIKESLF